MEDTHRLTVTMTIRKGRYYADANSITKEFELYGPLPVLRHFDIDGSVGHLYDSMMDEVRRLPPEPEPASRVEDLDFLD